MSDREAAMAELYRRNAMKPEQKAAYEELMRRGLVRNGPERSLGQRLLDNLDDAFNRSGAGQVNREYDPNQSGLDISDVFQAPRIREGGLIDRGLDAVLGSDRGALRGSTALRPVDQAERNRRRRYDALATADPIKNPAEFAAFLTGQVLGSGVSPENWVAPGRTVVGRAVGNAGVAAGADVLLQGNDVMGGIQDRFSALQTAGAAALGSTLSLGFDAVRPVSSMVRRAFTDPVTPRVEPEGPAAAAGAPEAPAQATAAATIPDAPVTPRAAPETATATAALEAAAAPAVVVPEFGIVQRVDKKSPLRDALGRVREGELPQMVGDFLGRAYTAVVSDQHPLARATNELRTATERLTGKPLDLLPSEDPRKLARGRYDWASIGHQDLLHGVHAYRGLAPTTPAMSDVLSAVSVRAKRAGEAPEVALQRFNEYMVARRSLSEWDRFEAGQLEVAPISRTKDQAQAFLDHIDALDPEFRGLSDSVNEFAGGLLKKALDGGLIDKATHDASIAGRDFYVPLRRVMEDTVKGAGKGAGGNAAPEIKKFKGSQRDVIDPVSVLIERTYRLNQRIRQNELNLSLVRLGERFDAAARAAGDTEGNRWIRKVERPVRKVEGRPGDDTLDLFDTDAADEWRTGEVADNGSAIIYTWRDGKREAWEIVDQEWGRDVFEAMGGMSKDMQDTFLNTVAAGTTLLARTITRDPAFLFSNFIRDQVSTWILTDVGFQPGEAVVGVIDEFRGTDASRLYNVGGGLTGGANTAMLGEALHKADTLALAQKGIRAKYLSSLEGLLQLSEVTEAGNRLRVFQRAFERSRKAGLSEYDSLIEASFVARDLIDFGRHGSKMHYARRLVTFLNAYVQGLDKTLRTLGADGAMTRVPLKEALRPLFGMQVEPGKMRAEDLAALQLAGKAWTKVAAIATFGLTLSALYHDDPNWQQANERTRATHWIIPMGDQLIRVPKPFELAFLSNIAERGFEATVGQDERGWEKMWTGLGMLFAPPTGIPFADVIGGLKSNTNAQTGRPIVPEYLEAMPPELQYQTWNSSLSKALGDMLNISPAKIDYAIQGFGGPFGSYLLGASDAADPERPSGSWTDLPVARRFVSPAFRGSQDKRDFYDRAGARNSDLRRALNGVREYQERGQVDKAQVIFQELDEPGRLFVQSQQGEMATRRLNPLIRAEVFAREASRMIGELNGAMPRDEGAPLPPMSRARRQVLEDAIERVTVAELRNAMVVTRQPGFQNRSLEDRTALWEELAEMAPEVAAELERRLGVGRDKAYDYDAVVELWPQVEQRLRTEGSAAYLEDLAADAQGRTQSWGERMEDEDEAEPLNLRL